MKGKECLKIGSSSSVDHHEEGFQGAKLSAAFGNDYIDVEEGQMKHQNEEYGFTDTKISEAFGNKKGE